MNLLYSEKMSHSLLAQKKERSIFGKRGLLTAIKGSEIFTLMFICEFFRHHGRVKHRPRKRGKIQIVGRIKHDLEMSNV